MLCKSLQSENSSLAISVNPLNIGLFSLGAVIHAASYLSFAPVLLAVSLIVFFHMLLYLSSLGGVWERHIFTRVFLVGYLMAGVAAVYANQLLDQSQLFSDAGGFYELATKSNLRYLPLIELQALHEGALAIKLWGIAYDFFSAVGFPKERYVGILMNVSAVAMTGVVTLKMARLVYGHDPHRFKLLTLIFSLCGLFWIFAGIHLRDSAVLLSITSIGYVWIYFLQKPDVSLRLVLVIVASVFASAFLGFLRGEFAFVPIAIAMAAIATLMFVSNSRRGFVTYFLAIIGLGLLGWSVATIGETILDTLLRSYEGYAEHAADEHSSDSLGMALIVNQAMPIRLLLGSIYLFVFPIPFWSGFQLDSVYNLFKSFNVIFFYFFLPLLVLALIKIWKHSSTRSSSIVFLLIFATGFIMAIAGTSLETRHFGVFLPPMFVLALLPDLRIKAFRRNYIQLLTILFAGVFMVHLVWFLLKI
jgi:hypothetical protein